MNPALRAAVSDLVSRCLASGLQGHTADPREVAALARDLGGRLPDWYAELLTSAPLCGVSLEVPTGEFEWDDARGLFEWKHTVYWFAPDNIRLECLEAHPGTVLLEHGCICVAGNDGGDPLVFSGTECDDPPVYLIDHEAGDAAAMLGPGRTTVAPSLSELFLKARPVEGGGPE
jgi:hypothetical protein